MITANLTGEIDNLIRKAHRQWLQSVCLALGRAPDSMDARSLIAALPVTNNSDTAHRVANIIRQAEGVVPCKTLGASIDVCTAILVRWQQEQHIELLWTGPSPA